MKKTKKIIPKSKVSEEEFLEVLEKITKRLAHKFKFGYHSVDDMKQQAAIFALEGLKNYDNSRPLENFLWTHVRNRLFNYKRNNYQRPDKPCLTCEFYDEHYKCSNNQCSKFVNKNQCELYKIWAKRNDAKKNIAQPSHFEDLSVIQSFQQNLTDNYELINFLDQHIKTEYREIYLKVKHNSKVNKSDLIKLQKHIVKLMEDNNCQIVKYLKNEDS